MNKLREKIGELFMVGYPGTDPAAASDLIQRHHIGGIILFSRNITDAARTRAVCTQLQEMRRRVSDEPLLIAVDQEGGCVARITEGVTVFPGNMALGAIGSENVARQVGRVTAAELSALGVNVNFAPVLDVSSNPRNPGVGARSFSSDPALAARLGAAMIQGMQENGVLATAKHFPGLGEAKVDSHDELPIVDLPSRRLQSMELVPFRSAVEAGVGFVMTAHCSYPAFDRASAPATLSKPILDDLLRHELGFHGLIITDCLEMGAVEKLYPAHKSASLAFRAGADILLICHTLEKQLAAIDSLAEQVEAGKIAEARVEESLERIRLMKRRVGMSPPERDYLPQKQMSEKIAARATTLINGAGIIPLRLKPSQKLALVTPLFELLTKVEENAEHKQAFLAEMKRFHQNLAHHEIPVRPSPDEAKAVADKCRSADSIVILTYNLHLHPAQQECVQALVDLKKPAVVAAVRDPHDLAFVTGAGACLATYSFRECSLKALAGVLFGEIKPGGVLPIKLE
jgi:beta-N-acetylhexosaminidase